MTMEKLKKNLKRTYRFYREPLLSQEKLSFLLGKIKKIVPEVQGLETERVFCVGSEGALKAEEKEKLSRLLRDRRNKKRFSQKSFLSGTNIIEVGPRLNFATSDSTNAVSICKKCGLKSIYRLEQGRRYKIIMDRDLLPEEEMKIISLIHDKMIECYYPKGLRSFRTGRKPKKLAYIPTLKKGKQALIDAKKKYGGSMDDADMEYILYLFNDVMKRDITDVEFCYLNNANSEHSRHHIFRARLIIDGEPMPFTLMNLVQSTLKNKDNSIIAFHDNSSVIGGFETSVIIPEKPGMPSRMRMAEIFYHLVLTAETHNHPSLWEAYAGAATGGGGRRRDNQATGRGAMVVAGGAGFMGGNLNIEGYPLPWEDSSFLYDELTESPLSFFIRATNGCFNDGNEYGEAVINLFFESFGMRIGGQRWENVKPVMYTVGFGFMDSRHVEKNIPQKGWLVVKVGGDAYRIGFGGGAASSLMAGENKAKLDLNSVQRADGEMANKTNKYLRTCTDMGDENPIETMTDQGAGGVTNASIEMVCPAGAKFYLGRIKTGDETLSPVEKLVCEFQENLHIIVRPENLQKVLDIGEREDVPVAVIGEITGDGRVVIVDEETGNNVLDLDLSHVFSQYPQKEFSDTRQKLDLQPLVIPEEMSVLGAADRVLRHIGVCSKEWAVNKVDQSVTGKIVQSMRDGATQLPICDYSIITPGPFSKSGQANAVAQRPAIGLISPESMVRVVAAEGVLKLAPVVITNCRDIKSSANWMLAVKLPGGLAWLTDAMMTLKKITDDLKFDINGGKDSMSMAAQVPASADGKKKEIARSLSTLVLSVYAQCPDYEMRVTPSFKHPGESSIIFVDLANGKTRMGGSVLAQCLNQVGDKCPDVDDPQSVNNTFDVVQNLVKKGLISAYHHKDRGGIMVTLLEMLFGGNCGASVQLSNQSASALKVLYNEELGCVIECKNGNEDAVMEAFGKAGLKHLVHHIGNTMTNKVVDVIVNGQKVFCEDMRKMRLLWRETSYQMELKQNVESCVRSERENLYDAPNPSCALTFNPDLIAPVKTDYVGKPKAAVIRVEGVNSDEEARNSLYLAGFDVYDINLNDIVAGSLKKFQFILFPGGFTYKDVLGSAVGWAAVIKHNESISKEFREFFERPDTLSLGICNGCQLMAELGVVPYRMPEEEQPAFVHNRSEKFETRPTWIKIQDSPSVLCKDMSGSILPVHLAHGEGRFDADDSVLDEIKSRGLVMVSYVDPEGRETEKYPFCPNGSKEGIAGLCTADGRHNMLMPHPERTSVRYQLPNSVEWQYENSPWLRMFQNARIWCNKNK
ncbi:MAG: phosphoribosylformylglycinamidine synthase [Candidatus Moranbacteria bacterium]|nr:phosphoribosylformylglycinamidine synthase [Candidatus Moranbacteria bacterium]